jgi:ureidoacrylate peracid hydrolase
MKPEKTLKDAWCIDPARTALVVVDMQRAFVDEGALLEVTGAGNLVPKMNELAAACRRLKIPVIFVKADRRADLSDSGLMVDFGSGQKNNKLNAALQGKEGNRFCAGLNVKKGDYVVPKIRYSAFIQGSSTIEPLLRGLNRDSFIICGVATDVCVGTSAMDAMMLGFRVFLVSDLTATFSLERQKAALETYDKHFAKVMSFQEVMKELGV